MKKPLGKFILLNRITGLEEECDLFVGVDDKNLNDYMNCWKPAFDGRLPEGASVEDRYAANMADGHWDWRLLAGLQKSEARYQMFSVECAGATQGLMLVDSAGRSRLQSKSPPLVYIERLATAPFNRPGFVANPVYKGVGQLFIATAINFSLEEELGGAIALHALESAETFYRDCCRMSDLGLDPDHEGLRYFEMTGDEARAYLGL